MEVILLEKITNLGNFGDKVNVKSGYGRNYLIPSGKALPITSDNLAKLEMRRAEMEKAAREKLTTAQERGEALRNLGQITLTAKAGEEGKLFGSIGASDIVDALAEQGLTIEKQEVRLPEGPLRNVGEHEVTVHLHSDVNEQLKVIIFAET